MGRFALFASVVIGMGTIIWATGIFHAPAQNTQPGNSAPGEETISVVPMEVGQPLCKIKPALSPPRAKATGADPIAVENCRLVVIEKVDVPSQRNGVLFYIGTNVKEGEKIPPDRVVYDREGKVVPGIKKLKEDDVVVPGQLLALLDDRVARDEFIIKKHEIVVAESEKATSDAARDESKQRWETGKSLQGRDSKAMSREEVNERLFAYKKFFNEAGKRVQEIELAKLKMNQTQTILSHHELRSTIHGVIKTIYKNAGEAVKSEPSYEPVFQIVNLSKLRAEGLVDEQYLPRLRKGMKVLLEPSQSQASEQTFIGHLQEITGVAVTRDNKPRIVSVSLDGTIRLWERGTRHELDIIRHPGAIRSVACTPAGAPEGQSLALTGGADGVARLWDLNSPKSPPRELAAKHRGAITCVAFSPDGAYCALGGEDREISLCNVETGELMYRLLGHTGGVTALQFTPTFQLVSAARDNTIRLWEELGTTGYDVNKVVTISRRSGDVSQPGVSPDGRYVMFDPWQSKSLRILSLPDGLTEGVLQNLSGSYHFTTLAQFSPDGKWILTAGAADGRLQLWRSPNGNSRAYVQRQLVTQDRAQPTCAAFAANGSFMVVGMRDRHLHIWPMHFEGNIEQPISAVISNVEKSVDAASRQVRIWAEFDNPGALLPGAVVTMVRVPE